MKQILLIEDDPDLADILSVNLLNEGYALEAVTNGIDGLERLNSKTYDLLILDIMLPGMDGLEICRKVRAMAGYLPIIIVSAKSTETQRILGLELGSDDYLSKPFSLDELIARIRALLRRVSALDRLMDEKAGTIYCGDLVIDPIKREAKLETRPVILTAKEFDLLLFFARNPGKAFTRLALLDNVWGYRHGGYEHTVNSHINRLRSKIDANNAKPNLIQTVWGIGYKFMDYSGTGNEI
ncbi:MAG: response regulator transcription factor [Methylococcaceae bacterium]|jgi:DNA-binding response OmpR family regulator